MAYLGKMDDRDGPVLTEHSHHLENAHTFHRACGVTRAISLDVMERANKSQRQEKLTEM
jgi:hypothetical protein